jgi:hypothetical protein
VPWCSDCDRFYNPNSLNPDGTCPTCGRQVAEEPAADGEGAPPEKLRKFSDDPAPWHFKVLIAVTSVYLGFRALQGIQWVAHHV